MTHFVLAIVESILKWRDERHLTQGHAGMGEGPVEEEGCFFHVNPISVIQTESVRFNKGAGKAMFLRNTGAFS